MRQPRTIFVLLEVFTHVSQNVFSCVGAFFFQSVLVPLRLGATSSVSRDCSHMTNEETSVFECAAAWPSWLDSGGQTCSADVANIGVPRFQLLSLSTHLERCYPSAMVANDACQQNGTEGIRKDYSPQEPRKRLTITGHELERGPKKKTVKTQRVSTWRRPFSSQLT